MKEDLCNLKLRYFDISWLSRFDGPGHRVVLYLQGCHLQCPWCHSPHSQTKRGELLYFPSRCLNCGSCVSACPSSVHHIKEGCHTINRSLCVACGKCVDACPVSSPDRVSGALALPVKEMTVSELWHLLYPQLDFVRSIGGLTVSGGEALLQSEALIGLLRLCKEQGIHTAVETSGALPPKYVNNIAPLVDCWLFGLRPTPFYIPPHADQISNNLTYLSKTGTRIIIRTPVIAGITDLPESLDKIAEIMQTNGLSEIQLLPFNRDTSHYYNALNKKCQLGNEAFVDQNRLDVVHTFFLEKDLIPLIIQ